MNNFKNIISVSLIAIATSLNGQVRFPDPTLNSAAPNSSAFIDASSSSSINNSANLGKGMLYPRVDLTKFSAFGGAPIGIPASYPTRYDGFIVYNTATTGVAGVGNTQGTSLSPGFWYYENKSTTTNGGTWKPLGSDGPWRNADGTAANGLSTDINFVQNGGSVTVGNSANNANFNVTGSVKFDALSTVNAGSNLLIEDGAGNVQKISVSDLKTLLTGKDEYQVIGSGRIVIDDIDGGGTQWHHLYGSDIVNTTTNITLTSNVEGTSNLQVDFKNPLTTSDYIVLTSISTPKYNNYYLNNFHADALVSDQTNNGFTLSAREEVQGIRSCYVDYVIMYNKNRNLASISGYGIAADNKWHTALLSEKGKYAVNSMSMRASIYLDGEITLNGEIQTEALNSADKIYQGEYGTTTLNSQTNTRDISSNNTYHTTVCPDNRVMTGIQIWASDNYLDGYMKLECTALNTGYKTNIGVPAIGGQGPSALADNQVHFAKCPDNQYIKGVRIYANQWLDGNMGLYCTPITKP